MTISELINELHGALNSRGDMDVCIYDSTYGYNRIKSGSFQRIPAKTPNYGKEQVLVLEWE